MVMYLESFLVLAEGWGVEIVAILYKQGNSAISTILELWKS